LCFFFLRIGLSIKKTPNSTKHSKKNEYYNEIFEKPFIFNLQTVLTARRRCHSFLSQSDVVGCGREVAERVKKDHIRPEDEEEGRTADEAP
jgi:hypothetical protein